MNGLEEVRTYFAPTKLVSGVGAIRQLPQEVEALGGGPVLCITDPGLRKAGLVEVVEDVLRGHGLQVTTFDQVAPDPDVEVVHACEEVRQQSETRVLVAIGGGSSMDTAKAVGILATNGGHISDYEGREKNEHPPLPLVAIPTTVGTGSEVTRGVVVADHDRRVKFIIGSSTLAPRVAILDPDLVTSLPPRITAATGMDALTHAIEGYVSTWATPMTDAATLHGMRLIGRHLRPAVANAANKEAIGTMLAASTTVGLGFGNARLGICHSLAHPVQAHAGSIHGETNGVLLPHVMAYNWVAAPDKFRAVNEALGDDDSDPEKAVATVAKLRDDVGLPTTLRDLGVEESQLDQIAAEAINDGYVQTNPRTVTVDTLRNLLQRAF